MATLSSSRHLAMSIPKTIGNIALGREIAKGNFSKVYEGRIEGTNKIVAIKLEKKDGRDTQLEKESRIYELLKLQNGFPKFLGFCEDINDTYRALIMECLGPSLEQMRIKCGGKFTLKTTLQLANQMFLLIETVHKLGIIYGDVKPENFLLGDPRSKKAKNDLKVMNRVHLIDFGLSQLESEVKYNEARGIKPKKYTNTLRYASVYQHLNKTKATRKRDDLESLAYVWILFIQGILPWQGHINQMANRNKNDTYAAIGDDKRNTPIELLCRDCPEEFAIYLRCMRNESQEVDYEYLKNLLQTALNRVHEASGGNDDYDWGVLTYARD